MPRQSCIPSIEIHPGRSQLLSVDQALLIVELQALGSDAISQAAVTLANEVLRLQVIEETKNETTATSNHSKRRSVRRRRQPIPEPQPSRYGPVASDDDRTGYEDAVDLVVANQKASISFVQRKLRIGFMHADRLIKRMEAEGVLKGPISTGGYYSEIRRQDPA